MKGKREISWKVWLFIVLSFVLSFGIILGASVPESYDYTVGDICTEDIYTTRDTEDSYTTKRRREAAASQVENQYKINYELNESMLKKVQKLLSSVSEARGMEIALNGKIAFVKDDIEMNLSDGEISYLLTMSAENYGEFSKEVRETFSDVMDKGVEETDTAIVEMNSAFEEKIKDSEKVSIAGKIFSSYARKNEELDIEKTQSEKDKAMKAIEPTVYKKGQIVVRRGEVLSDEQISLLADMGVFKGSAGISKKYALGIFLFVLFVYSVAAYYIGRKSNRKKFSNEKIILTCILTVIMLIAIFFLKDFKGNLVYLIPIPYCAIMVGTFAGSSLSAIVNVFITFATAIMLGQTEEYIIGMAIFSAVATIIFKRVEGFSGYAKAMLYTILGGAVSISMAMLITGRPLADIGKVTLYGGLNGIIASVLVVGTTPVFENIFNIITPFKLTDLGNPEKPLLKRLMFEAPGTYHHSLMVGNLAEAACIKIGANNQLARVSAYYHDIGKLKRPDYFFENQLGENPHDLMDPAQSATVLRSHVQDGLEIARQYRLPKDIRDVICQHHGTTLTGVFYKKAQEINPGAKEEDYKYPGPIPESKEAGIVMLADSCEAAVRSLDEKTEDAIRAMVTKIIKSRMSEGQLDRCDLSFRELGDIIEAFVSMLGSHFHKRIKYDNKEQGQNESDNRKA